MHNSTSTLETSFAACVGHIIRVNLSCFFSDNKALFVISMSDNGAQIYELVAQTVSEKTVYVLDIATLLYCVLSF